MNTTNFEHLARKVVMDWYNQGKPTCKLTQDEIHIVHMSTILQNNKARLVTSKVDSTYYDVTYDEDREVVLLNAYTQHTKFPTTSYVQRQMNADGKLYAMQNLGWSIVSSKTFYLNKKYR